MQYGSTASASSLLPNTVTIVLNRLSVPIVFVSNPLRAASILVTAVGSELTEVIALTAAEDNDIELVVLADATGAFETTGAGALTAGSTVFT